MPSRYERPPLGAARLVLTPRDVEMLRASDAHRFVRTDHFKQLFFGRSTLRSAQARLSALWRHGYLDRVYLASVVDGDRRPSRGPGVPVYKLGRRGALALRGDADVLAEARDVASPAVVQHHLVVTDFLVALEVAARGHPDLSLAEGVHEWDLWRRLAERGAPGLAGGHLVPDGAATILRTASGERETYYLEVVRAGVKAGNSTLWEKLLRYAELNHRGGFRGLYGHERVRAVLVATTTEERAEHFRSLAKRLPHGRRLFAFAAYEERGADDRVIPRFTPGRILKLEWKTPDGEPFALGASAPNTPPA